LKIIGMNNFKQLSTHFFQMLARTRETFKRRKYLWLLVLIITILYSSLSTLRHQHFTSSAYDLGIFDQAIWQYSQFQAPYSSVRSNRLTENLLGDHFHPIIAVLAPLYWLTDSVEALLIAQALLFAIAIVPIFLFTEKRLGQVAAYLFAISYSIFWGVQKAVEFDFHEIALAVPLTALAIYFIDEKRWRAYFICLVLLLLTKENLSILIFFFGVYLLAIRQYKRALISMGAGAIWFVAVTKIFIPFFIDPETMRAGRAGNYYGYWSYNHLGSNPLGVLLTAIKNPLLIIKTLFSPGAKLHTYWLLFHPFLFLAFFSPLFILAIPLLAERFLSENANLWMADFHYTAVLVPVLVMASVDGLSRITGRIKKLRPGYLIIPASCLVLLLNLRLLPQFPLWNLTSPAYWRLTSSDVTGRRALALIPPTASVITQGPITPHLTHRRIIYVLHPTVIIPDADFIVVSEHVNPFPFLSHQDIKRYLDYQQARGYRKIFDEDGWIVLKAEALTGSSHRQNNDASFVEQSVPASMIAGQTYDVFVTLKNTGIKTWKTSEAYRLAYLSGNRDWILERVELPSSIIEPGSIVKFEFNVKAPSKPGAYSFHWGMVQDGVAAFGESAPEVWVKVSAAESSH
jgi:uncharacterized membrane protein